MVWILINQHVASVAEKSSEVTAFAVRICSRIREATSTSHTIFKIVQILANIVKS